MFNRVISSLEDRFILGNKHCIEFRECVKLINDVTNALTCNKTKVSFGSLMLGDET